MVSTKSEAVTSMENDWKALFSSAQSQNVILLPLFADTDGVLIAVQPHLQSKGEHILALDVKQS